MDTHVEFKPNTVEQQIKKKKIKKKKKKNK